MKKIITLTSLMFILSFSHAQVVFQSNFSSWSGGAPTDWLGSSSTITNSSVWQHIIGGASYGPFRCGLQSWTTSALGLATQTVSVVGGTTYEMKVYVRSTTGEMALGYYDVTNSTYSPIGTFRNVLSTTLLTEIDSFTIPATCTNIQFIVYARNTPAFGTGTQGVSLDSVAIYAISSPPAPTVSPYKPRSIYEIQYTTASSGDSPYEDSLVETTGIVTATFNNGYWIQDSAKGWNGLYVYDNSNTPALGDEIMVHAEVDEYFNLTELKNVDTLITVSTGNTLPTPVALTTTSLSMEEMYEGVLCKVSGVTCVNPSAGNGEWYILNTTDTAVVDDLIYAFSPIMASVYDVTGVVHYSFSEYKIEPRDSMDIVRLSSVSLQNNDEFKFGVFPNPTNEMITVTGINTGYAEVFSMDGKLVMSSNLVYTHSLDVKSLKNGVYILKITSDNQTGTTRFVKQ